MGLVDYGSDSDSEQAQQHQPKQLPGVQDDADSLVDDGDDDFNPQDAFGLARISEAEKQAAGGAGQAAAGPAAVGTSKSSAPEVISAVSRRHRAGFAGLAGRSGGFPDVARVS